LVVNFFKMVTCQPTVDAQCSMTVTFPSSDYIETDMMTQFWPHTHTHTHTHAVADSMLYSRMCHGWAAGVTDNCNTQSRRAYQLWWINECELHFSRSLQQQSKRNCLTKRVLNTADSHYPADITMNKIIFVCRLRGDRQNGQK